MHDIYGVNEEIRLGIKRIQSLMRVVDINRISDDVRFTEQYLKSLSFPRSVAAGPIRWDAQTKRLMCGDRALIECKCEPRIAGHKYLPELLSNCAQELETALGERGDA